MGWNSATPIRADGALLILGVSPKLSLFWTTVGRLRTPRRLVVQIDAQEIGLGKSNSQGGVIVGGNKLGPYRLCTDAAKAGNVAKRVRRRRLLIRPVVLNPLWGFNRRLMGEKKITVARVKRSTTQHAFYDTLALAG